MLMFGITVLVAMAMPGSVPMEVFMLVENDLQPAVECLGDPAKRRHTRNMIATLKAGDHRNRHTQACRQLFLGFAGCRPERHEQSRALCCNGSTVIAAYFVFLFGMISHNC